MNTQLTYRSGTIDDLQQLKDLGIAAFGTHATALTPDNWALMERNLHDETRLTALIAISDVFVCADGERMVGMAYLVPNGNPTHVYPADWCYVRMVSVHPEYRGNGICRQLMKQCIAKAIEHGETVMALHTSEIMNDARHVYETMGFQLVKELAPVFGLRYWLFRLDL